MKDTGGPAFPTKRRIQRAGYLTDEYEPCGGMTLRDYFAAEVLAGIWTNSELLKTFKRGQESEEIATAAYEMADAMLKARNQ